MSEDYFTFRIIKRTGSFGETAAQESAEVARLLRLAAHQIESGALIGRPDQRELKDRAGHLVADFAFGRGMVRGPDQSPDRREMQIPSQFQIANARRSAI